ncbi:MAG TPA: YceI family protein [Thermoanaerobaculia bacterium]
MKRLLITVIALAVFVAGVAAGDRYTPAKGSLVRIEGTSTLHDWKMEGTTIDGAISAPPIEQWQNGTAAAEVKVTIPVASIKSEHAKMDKLMVETLKTPVINYEMTKATLAAPGSAFTVATKGKLTIAGVTREVDMQVMGIREPAGNYVLNGQLPIKLTDYGMKPPKAMMGTIKTGNDVKVTFRWVVAAK